MSDISSPDIFQRAQKYVGDNDAAGFETLVKEVMNTSPSYAAHQAGAGDASVIKSAINKQKIDGIKDTTSDEYEALYKRATGAQAFWQNVPVKQRGVFAELLEKKLSDTATKNKLVFATAADVGKTTTDAGNEITKATEWLKWANHPKILTKLSPDTVRREVKTPVNIVGVVTSFNYPLALSMAGVVPAIMAGNAVIFKCSVKAPHWAFIFKDAFDSAMQEFLDEAEKTNAPWLKKCKEASALDPKLPIPKERYASLFGIISGRNNTLVNDVDNLFFVGGTDTGHKFEKQRDDASKIDGRRRNTHVELGGNAAVVILKSAFDGAPDIAAKAQEIAKLVFDGNVGNSGQRCTKAAVVIAQEGDEPARVIRELDALYNKGIKIGNPFDGQNKSGALVDDEALAKMEKLIKAAKAVGAVVSGGSRVGTNYAPHGGNYVNPALIDWSKVDEKILKSTVFDDSAGESLYHAITHETFAPVLHIVRKARDSEHAIELANEYDQEKLAVAVFSSAAEWPTLETGILATSKRHNQAPKDLSPWGEHGNWGHRYKSGGEDAFKSFTDVQNYDPAASKTHHAHLYESVENSPRL